MDNEKNIEIEKMNAEQAAIEEEIIVSQGKIDQQVIEEFSDEHLKKTVTERLAESRKKSDKDRFNKDVNRVMEKTITKSEDFISKLQKEIEELKQNGGLEADLLEKEHLISAHRSIIKAVRTSINTSEF